MGAPMFHRRCVLIVGKPQPDYTAMDPKAYKVEDLDIEFKVSKSMIKVPNTCEAKVYNFNSDARSHIQGKGYKLILQAGYPGNIKQIFSGDIRLIDHKRENASWITHLECGDGERAFQYARVNKSFGPQTTAADIVKSLVNSTGLKKGNLQQEVSSILGVYQNGYHAEGQAVPELVKVLKASGYMVSIHDGAIQILKPGQAFQGTVPLVSVDTGLIGSPEHSSEYKPGLPRILNVKSLLNPDIRAGGKIQLKSRVYSGTYLVQAFTATGNTRQNEWYTEMECLPIQIP